MTRRRNTISSSTVSRTKFRSIAPRSKRMALEGTIIINNPFWWSADDKFFNYSLAEKLGVAIPKTVLLPQKDYIEGIVSESLRNLEFPIDWQGIVDYVGFPAFLKPFDGGGWKNVSKINSLEELWTEYNKTGTLCMTLQEGIDFDQFVRCYCVGQEEVMIMAYDPSQAVSVGRAVRSRSGLSRAGACRTRQKRRAHALHRARLRHQHCRVCDQGRHAVRDRLYESRAGCGARLGRRVLSQLDHQRGHRTGVQALNESAQRPRYRWDALLNPEPVQAYAVASAAEQQARTITPKPDVAAAKSSQQEEETRLKQD